MFILNVKIYSIKATKKSNIIIPLSQSNVMNIDQVMQVNDSLGD